MFRSAGLPLCLLLLWGSVVNLAASDTGSSTDSGTGSSTDSGTGSSTDSGTGSGTGSSTGSGSGSGSGANKKYEELLNLVKPAAAASVSQTGKSLIDLFKKARDRVKCDKCKQDADCNLSEGLKDLLGAVIEDGTAITAAQLDSALQGFVMFLTSPDEVCAAMAKAGEWKKLVDDLLNSITVTKDTKQLINSAGVKVLIQKIELHRVSDKHGGCVKAKDIMKEVDPSTGDTTELDANAVVRKLLFHDLKGGWRTTISSGSRLSASLLSLYFCVIFLTLHYL